MHDPAAVPGGGPAAVSTLDAPHAWGRVLAAFLSSEEFAQQFPAAPTWGPTIHRAVLERLGSHLNLPHTQDAGKPHARRAGASVLQVLRPFAESTPFNPSLNNLLGFEWMEIAPLIAGHPVAHPLPEAGYEAPSSEVELAQYCLFGHIEMDIQQMEQGFRLLMSSPVPVPVRLLQAQLVLQRSEIVVRYQFGHPYTPVRVLQVGGKAIAVSGIERLVTLLRQGVAEALCLVSYGYGTDALSFLPTFPQTLLESDRPPVLNDFLEDRVSVSIPVRPVATSVLFQATTVPSV